MKRSVWATALLIGIAFSSYKSFAQDKKQSEDMLKQRVEIQQLKEQLRATKIQAAQCDAGWADTRARLASAELNGEGEQLKTGRESLDKLAKEAGFTIDWASANPVLKKAETAPPTNDKK